MLYLGFVLGLLGGFHCVGMCGPIALLLPFNRDNDWVKALQVALYFFGKTLTYCLLGLFFGVLGKGFFIGEYQQNFSIFVGVVMLFTGLLSVFRISVFDLQLPIFRGVNKLKSILGKQLHSKGTFSVFFIGFLNGFLPCGLVYTALFSALATANIPDTILYMICFGVGTAPLMIAFIYLGNFLSASVRKYIQKAIPFFLIIIAILFIIRGLGLGIPYISPASTNLIIQENPDCVVPMLP